VIDQAYQDRPGNKEIQLSILNNRPDTSAARVEERSLVPLSEARLGRIGFDQWLGRS
jgi:hypothetical protein